MCTSLINGCALFPTKCHPEVEIYQEIAFRKLSLEYVINEPIPWRSTKLESRGNALATRGRLYIDDPKINDVDFSPFHVGVHRRWNTPEKLHSFGSKLGNFDAMDSSNRREGTRIDRLTNRRDRFSFLRAWKRSFADQLVKFLSSGLFELKWIARTRNHSLNAPDAAISLKRTATRLPN